MRGSIVVVDQREQALAARVGRARGTRRRRGRRTGRRRAADSIAAKRGAFASSRASTISQANSGMMPTHENTSMRWHAPSGPTTRSLKKPSSGSHSDRPCPCGSLLPGDGVGDAEELLVALDRDVLVVGVLGRELERHHRHVEREHRHPAGGVGLLQRVARRQRLRAVVHGDVVEAEEAAFEHAVAVGVLAVQPPRVVEQQLVHAPAAGSRCRACRAARDRRGTP